MLIPLVEFALAASLAAAELPGPQSAVERQEYHIPRLLYPGTYGNYCGPTPEISAEDGCVARGWHGDDPVDAVDDACRLHDISYCKCESELARRRRRSGMGRGGVATSLASLTALRFATEPFLRGSNNNDDDQGGTSLVDAEYLRCVNKADKELIASGIRIRGEQQRQGCTSSSTAISQGDDAPGSSSSLNWFCSPQEALGTLSRFEKVSLNIFLRSLDADAKIIPSPDEEVASGRDVKSLMELETIRQSDFRRALKNGLPVRDAASGNVEQDDDRLLERLQIY